MKIELNSDHLQTHQSELKKGEIIILRFTADWCQPCKSINPLCQKMEKEFESIDNIKYYEIDIDESIDLYIKLKRYKMVSSIPALLMWKNGERENWYVPDLCVNTSNLTEVQLFFENCKKLIV